MASALDDIHLTGVLLHLKGTNVISDDGNTRIAAVKDEDFDFCFVPSGSSATSMTKSLSSAKEGNRSLLSRGIGLISLGLASECGSGRNSDCGR